MLQIITRLKEYILRMNADQQKNPIFSKFSYGGIIERKIGKVFKFT